LLNIFQADVIGCDIRDARHPEETPLVGKSLDEYSLDTVKTFYEDARAAGFSLSAVST
jgi:transaldolase